MRSAINKYIEFHQFEPDEIGAFDPSFRIPKTVYLAGDAVHVLYRSDKLNPMTGRDEGVIDYIHEHEKGVKVYRTDRASGGKPKKVPLYITRVETLTRLGRCLGFAYRDNGTGFDVEATPSRGRCELYTIPSGKALIVVERRAKAVALVWGGQLGVEWRGIVG